MAIAGQQPHPCGVPADQHSEPVVLNLVDPARAGRRPLGLDWQARRDEAGGGRAQHHTGGNIGGHSLSRISFKEYGSWAARCATARGAYCASLEMALIGMCYLTIGMASSAYRHGGRSHEEDDRSAPVWRANEGAEDQGEDRTGSGADGGSTKTGGGDNTARESAP